jgi:hypothetical protein
MNIDQNHPIASKALTEGYEVDVCLLKLDTLQSKLTTVAD